MRTLKNFIFFMILAVALVIGFPRWQVLTLAMVSGISYFPDFPFWPLWLPLGVAVVGYFVYFFAGLAMGLHIRLTHQVMVVVLFGAVLLARVFGLLGPLPGFDNKDDGESSPRELLQKAANRLKTKLDQRCEGLGNPGFPADAAEVEALLLRHGKLPPSGFRKHGLKATVELVVVNGAEGPILGPGPNDRAGTLYYAVREDGSQYWITMLTLAEFPSGPAAILEGPGHNPIVLGSEPESTPDED